MNTLTIEELRHKRDKAERDLMDAYAIRDDGREAHIEYWENAFHEASDALNKVLWPKTKLVNTVTQ
jgi:hypothetical protein